VLLGCGLGLLAASGTVAAEPPSERPSIWVTANDRAPILEKIEKQAWAQAQYATLLERSAERRERHRADPDAYLRALPWKESEKGGHPVLPPINANMASAKLTPEQSLNRSEMQTMLANAIDNAVLYYLTQDPAYAAVGGDVLQALVGMLRGLTPSDSPTNGGWFYPGDHLYEARILGAQLPILYDFVATYLRQPDVKVWDLATRRPVPFDFAGAQEVFRTYARLAVEHGNSDTNWPVLEMPSLTHNTLALEDPKERAHWLGYVTHVETERQSPISKIVRELSEAGGVWPESNQYANDVAGKTTYIVALLKRQTMPLELPSDIGAVARSMVRLRDFTFPNQELIRFGDGMRHSRLPITQVEFAYTLAARTGDQAGMAEFGGVVREALEDGSYDRAKLGAMPTGANVYLAPLSLLWFEPEIQVPARLTPKPKVTDQLPFAGIVLQRNLAPGGNVKHALMAAVQGASYVHSHASGMSLELYGAGRVLATNAGKGTYRSEEHENYRRIFAAHNGVIVNGASTTAGRWANLGIDTVRPLTLEPAFGAEAVSPRHSFTVTGFTDRQLGEGEAEQERTVGIVRTSDLGGYYVDVFRSRVTKGDRADQFHDYVFHHVGDRVEWRGASGPLALTPAPERFKPVSGTKWANNGTYLYPGWHYFQDAKVAVSSEKTVLADFFAEKIDEAGLGQRLHMPSGPGREYARASAPHTTQSPGDYATKRTPTIVVRQKGEAWDRPFAVIHEPYAGTSSAAGIREVVALETDGQWHGLVVDGEAANGAYRHYVLVPEPGQAVVRDRMRELEFAGRYAVISVDANGDPKEIYVGEGTALSYRGVMLSRKDGKALAAHVEKTAEGWNLRTPDRAAVTFTAPPAAR
jgi:hypothetical protein